MARSHHTLAPLHTPKPTLTSNTTSRKRQASSARQALPSPSLTPDGMEQNIDPNLQEGLAAPDFDQQDGLATPNFEYFHMNMVKVPNQHMHRTPPHLAVEQGVPMDAMDHPHMAGTMHPQPSMPGQFQPQGAEPMVTGAPMHMPNEIYMQYHVQHVVPQGFNPVLSPNLPLYAGAMPSAAQSPVTSTPSPRSPVAREKPGCVPDGWITNDKGERVYVPAKRKRNKRDNDSPKSEEEQRREALERNRQAATKSRMKKRQNNAETLARYDVVRKGQKDLLLAKCALKSRVYNLKNSALAECALTCGCKAVENLQKYMLERASHAEYLKTGTKVPEVQPMAMPPMHCGMLVQEPTGGDAGSSNWQQLQQFSTVRPPVPSYGQQRPPQQVPTEEALAPSNGEQYQPQLQSLYDANEDFNLAEPPLVPQPDVDFEFDDLLNLDFAA